MSKNVECNVEMKKNTVDVCIKIPYHKVTGGTQEQLNKEIDTALNVALSKLVNLPGSSG
jgi:hypothetical protein